MSKSDVVKETSSIVVSATVIVDCSFAEMNCRSLEVAMFLIVLPVITSVERINVMNGSEIRLLPSITLFVKTTVPKKEERKAFWEEILVLLSKDIVDYMLTSSTLLVARVVMLNMSSVFSLNSLAMKQNSTQMNVSVKYSSAAMARFP